MHIVGYIYLQKVNLHVYKDYPYGVVLAVILYSSLSLVSCFPKRGAFVFIILTKSLWPFSHMGCKVCFVNVKEFQSLTFLY